MMQRRTSAKCSSSSCLGERSETTAERRGEVKSKGKSETTKNNRELAKRQSQALPLEFFYRMKKTHCKR